MYMILSKSSLNSVITATDDEGFFVIKQFCTSLIYFNL